MGRGRLRTSSTVRTHGHKSFSGVIDKTLDSVLELDNAECFATIAFYLVPPTGGRVRFEACFDGNEWVPITLRGVNSDLLVQTADSADPVDNYLGSCAGTSKFRVKTIVAGSANGSISGRFTQAPCVIETIEFGYPPHKIGYDPVHKDASFTTTQTGTAIWTPASGKRAIITDMIIICGGVTDARVTIFDETNSSGNILFDGLIDVSNNKQYSLNHSFRIPYKSSAANNSIKLTTTADIVIDIILHGYEIS